MSKPKKDHVVTVRFSDLEYDFLNKSIDYFYCDNLSDVIRGLVRNAMKEESKELQRVT